MNKLLLLENVLETWKGYNKIVRKQEVTGAAEAMKIYLGQSVYKKVYLPKIFYRGRGNSENKRISNSTRIAKESLALMPTALSGSTTPVLALEPEN